MKRLGHSSVFMVLVVLTPITFISYVFIILPMIWQAPKWSMQGYSSVTLVFEAVYCQPNVSNVFILKLPDLVSGQLV
jgi:hypothetical protein